VTPPPNRYHRWLGWHALELRRALVVAVFGLAVCLALLPFIAWHLAVVAGWDVASVGYLLAVWPIIARADTSHVEHLATREDETRGSATLLQVGACVISLLGVGSALILAGRQEGALRMVLIAFAVVTVVLSWAVLNTVYTLRYAHLHFASRRGGIAFGDAPGDERPTYREFAYVAFTIGMTYQVSDTTVRDRRIRHTVLMHATLSYVFGVVIVAGAINLIAGMVR
jgi:uncharacterized membrane protein